MRNVIAGVLHKLFGDRNQHVDNIKDIINKNEINTVSVRRIRDIFVQSSEERGRNTDIQSAEQQI